MAGGSLLKKQKTEVRSTPQGGLQGRRDAAASRRCSLRRTTPSSTSGRRHVLYTPREGFGPRHLPGELG